MTVFFLSQICKEVKVEGGRNLNISEEVQSDGNSQEFWNTRQIVFLIKRFLAQTIADTAIRKSRNIMK